MRFSRVLLIATFAVAVLLLPSLASADGATWTLENVTLIDTGTITGTFNFDALTMSYSAIDITSTSGSLLCGATYTTLTPSFVSGNSLLGVGPATIPGGDYTGLTFLEIFFNNALTNSGGSDPLFAEEVYCSNSTCSDQIFRISNGSSGMAVGVPVSAPEPTSILLLVAGLLALSLLRPIQGSLR